VRCLLLFGLIWLGAHIGGRWVGRRAASRDVKLASIQEGAPTGLLGAEWLMPVSRVQQLFPAAVRFPAPEAFAESLKIEAAVFGRQASVDFLFSEADALVMIVVSFKGSKTAETYGSVHPMIEETFGLMSLPDPVGDYELASTKRFSRIVVEHVLYEQHGVRLEQVLLYRTGSG
jgi:hypothetical protein